MDSKQLDAYLVLHGAILDLPFRAEARREPGSPPTFEGGFDPPETVLDLADLVGALLPAGLQLPAALPRIELTNLAVRLTPDSGEFSFQGDAILILGQTFSLAGINLSLPSTVTFHVSLVRAGAPPQTTLTIGASLPANEALTVSSNLAWARELAESTLREVQNDGKERPKDLVSLALSWNQGSGLEMTLVEMTLGPAPATTYFSDIRVAGAPDEDVHLSLDFALNTGGGFDFPFLKQDALSGVPGALSQRIAIGRNGAGAGDSLHFGLSATLSPGANGSGPPSFDIDLPLTLYLGNDLEFEAQVPFTFDLGTLALSIDHEQGVHLLASRPSFTTPELLGLSWTFAGARVPDETRYHYFTLVTKSLNYQLQLAPGAHIDLAYSEISQEPIVFRVSEFVLSSRGLTLTAGVTDTPVRLNGLDCKFRFQGSQLRIVENKIQDLTIAGSGPLPPDLVGDAVADVALQFKQVKGGLRLVSGAAQLRGQKPLECKATRFQFSLDALGLKFVYDQKFHLYFTLTGQAKFVPAPADDPDGPLSWLPEVTLDLVDCPLTGDASVIAQHIEFLVELPKPLSFSFLGAYDFQLRAIGFLPQCEKFEGRGAMLLSGQVQFAQGKGDIVDPRPDFHKLYIGLPPKGQDQPQVDMGTLPVGIKSGQKFKLSGAVAFKFESTMQGFKGDGVLEIKGLPPMAASFGFMRVRRDADEPWLRAWFIYLEVRQISFQIPVLQFYIREVGLGFGYRFTLVAIKRAEEANDLKQLIQDLKALSRTQGDLSKQDRWAVDLEAAGEDPRWTIVLRAMISQLSAAPSPLSWDALKEERLSNTYLFDAIVAVRSDLTFFMAVRGWLNTNYATFVAARNKNQPLNPLFSGFVFLWPRERRFLAHLASNPDGHLGTREYPLRPPLPPFVVEAIRHSQFSATLLIEPALMHFELGWPNMLRWSDTLGPLTAEICGGFIFRITADELVLGVSLLARARLRIAAQVNLGLVGASLTASADTAFGARYIGVIPFQGGSPVMYGAVGLELRIDISVSLWIKIPLLFVTLKLSFRFSFSVGFTAGLEFGLNGLDSIGLRGRATVSLSMMGHSLHFQVHLNHNPDAIAAARQRTEKYLSMGLEATDVEAYQPGIAAPTEGALPSRALDLPGALPFSPLFDEAPPRPAFTAPHYSAFVLRGASRDAHTYFVLLPRGEGDDGAPERGFLPVPPAQDVDWTAEDYQDFELKLESVEIDGVQRFDPHHSGAGDPWLSLSGAEAAWKANWDAPVVTETGTSYVHPDLSPGEDAPHVPQLTLRQYLRQAFLVSSPADRQATDPPTLDDVVPIGDPEPHGNSVRSLQDPRVQNPSDSAFEAAVRGAVEQFRGSPLFKHDPSYAYDQALEQAFRPDTTVYTASGLVPDDPDQKAAMEGNQQAIQVRGLVIHELVDDLRQYVGRPEAERAGLVATSIPFQMGLVFRVAAGRAPSWLQDAGSQAPKICQRLTPQDRAPNSGPRPVCTFNVRGADFEDNAPQFQRVQHFTDANTIAIAWDLEWAEAPGLSGAQADPEHHLQYYLVRRRALDGRTPEVVYRVKNASVLHLDGDGVLNCLKPRFQVVDHFNDETLEEQAGLPTTGRSYLYTITPVDVAGKMGQPLSLVATRFPNEPPRVPVDGELAVEYCLSAADLQPVDASATGAPRPPVLAPAGLQVTWTEPSEVRDGPTVAIDDYYLIFRREQTLPIGSYGLDSTTQRARSGLLPTSNARPLPSDLKILLTPSGRRGERRAERARLHPGEPDDAPLLDVLRRAGIFPAGADAAWRPDSWRVFFQTVSANQVPSPLAPVQLLLRVRSDQAPGPEAVEERRPSELEWLPRPVCLPLLPPEDQQASDGLIHVPMPQGDFKFGGGLDNVGHRPHPQGLRCIRFRWNQGPSGLPGYPLDLTAGYDLLELDVDAHTRDTFQDADRLSRALRPIQEAQMLPAADLLLTPGDTLSPSQWEAWYPSALLRHLAPQDRPEGSASAQSPWYSWRESILEWPDWPGGRSTALHPFLGDVVEALKDQGLTVDQQTGPPFGRQDFAAFLESTAPEVDPYGWGVLQRFGLSVAFSLHDPADGRLLAGQALLNAVAAALESLRDRHAGLYRHLHVELLFQPGRRGEMSETPAYADALLGLVQLSLRPAIRQELRYARIPLEGQAGSQVEVEFTYTAPFSFIDQADPAAGQVDVDGAGQSATLRRTLTLPANGRTHLLLRGEALPTVRRIEPAPEQDMTLIPFPVTDPLSAYFARPVDSLAAAFAAAGAAGDEWDRFKRYAESLNSNDGEQPRIEFRIDAESLKEQLTGFLSWALRFFDAAAPVSAGNDGLGRTRQDGPWLATAYPRAATPAQMTPDEAGRLTYDHLLADRWAHTYRYYIRPYNRYRLLWRSLLQSPALFPRESRPAGVLDEARPDPAAGGLDVVLDRTQPVDRPLVLSSARLDPPGRPGQPVAPGSTWEVIIAQHPEQSLVERNQTLARQLSFRQVAFTLLRRFAYADWVRTLEGAVGKTGRGNGAHAIDLKLVENALPASHPLHYPDRPDHVILDPGGPLADDVACSLDLPARIGRFQQGALVLQWEALPFFYEHRLLLVAQTASTVSPVNEVTQRDFEYRSPDLFDGTRAPAWAATVEGSDGIIGAGGARGRLLRLPLHRFWDSLPPSAQAQWLAEAPSPDDGDRRKPASLPDPEVVYQLIEIYEGNLELQAEFYFDHAAGRYAVRQLGKRLLAEIVRLVPPGAPQADYTLEIMVCQANEVTLQRAYDLGNLPEPTRNRLALADGRWTVTGVFTRRDRAALLLHAVGDLYGMVEHPGPGADLAQAEAFLAEWYPSRRVSNAPELPEVLVGKVAYRAVVALDGALSDEQQQALASFAAMTDVRLRAALQGLAAGRTLARLDYLAESDLPGALQPALALSAGGSQMAWTGAASQEQFDALAQFAGSLAAGKLAELLRAASFEAPYPAPPAPEVPPLGGLAERLSIEALSSAGWQMRWTGAITAADERALWELLDDPNYRLGLQDLIAQILAAQIAHVEALEDTDPARPLLDEALQAFAELASAADAAALEPVARAGFPEEATFEVTIPWRITAAQLGHILSPEAAAHLTIAESPDEPIRWQSALGVDAGALLGRVRAGLDADYPAVQAFTQAFERLMDRMRAARFVVDYRLAARDVPPVLAGSLDLQATLLHANAFLTQPEREALRALFPSGDDSAAVEALLHDLADREVLDGLYDGWLSREPVSAAVPLDGLPADLRDRVEFQADPVAIRHHGILSREEARALQALYSSAEDRAAIERLFQASAGRGLGGSAFKILARRGAAAPSPNMRDLDVAPLAG